MKLLFDENLSPKLVRLLEDIFPGSAQIELLGMRGETDLAIWEFAKREGFTIVSKDNDFRQRSFLLGAPPKVIWLSVGNLGTSTIAAILEQNASRIAAFLEQDEGLLIL